LGPSHKIICPTWCPKLVTGLLCPGGPHGHLSGPACMSNCIRREVRLPLDQHVLCSECCKKMSALCLAQVVFYYFVLHSSKLPMVLTIEMARGSTFAARSAWS